MHTRSKFLTAASTALLAGGLSIAGAGLALAGNWGEQGDDGHSGQGQRPIEAMFKSFDSDNDGRLTQAEVDTGRSHQLADVDSNGDRKLTLEEFQALWVDAAQGRVAERFQRLDENGDGLVSEAEFSAPTADIVARLDRDGDGALSRADKKRKYEDNDYDSDD